MAVCTPTTAVQGQGSINVAYLRQESQQVTTAYGERTNLADIYAFTASPATGWVFDHFEIVTTYDFGSYVETPSETHIIETSSSPLPITNNPFQTVGLATQTISDYHSIGEYYGTGRYRPTYKTLTYTVTAIFVQAPTTYTITTTSSPVGGGTTTGGGTYSSGASCTLTATPASGYSFVRWEKNGAQVSTSASYTFTVSESATYTAIFEQAAPVTYTITTAVTPAGSGTATGGGTFNSGASCTLTATPASGYSFVRWEKNGVQVSTSASYAFTVSESATYTAIFESSTPLVHIVVTTFKSAGKVTLNGVPGDDTQSTWTTVSADIPVGDSVTITATPTDPNVHPFKAWYLNPSAAGDPEHSGTLVPGAGATYTFTASASATYFATFESGGAVVVSTTPTEAQPEAKVSINGQTNNTYEYDLDVPTGSTVTVSASERGGPQSFPYFTMYYFAGWIDNDPDSPTYGTTLSTDRVYTFQLATKQGNSGPYSYANLLAQYAEFEQIETEVMPNVAMGRISASPPPKDGEWFPLWSTATFTATPSPHYRFVKWTELYPTGYEYDYSTNNQITLEVGTQPRVVFRAYFEWDGTDLLVNSANLGSPVQLVYDPATNLLVADY